MSRIGFVVFFFLLPLVVWAEGRCVDQAVHLRSLFSQEVEGISLGDEYKGMVFSKINSALDSNPEIKSSQYMLLIDRNPSVQLAILFFVNTEDGTFVIVGADKVSTGNPSRRGHFLTPLGFYENSPTNMSYRALGTKNSRGWRGFGVKGRRVWDFGWQQTTTKSGAPYQIRMLMHATDPGLGEKQLGKVASKGCIRVSGRFNRFLDRLGILDAEYENHPKSQYVLLPDREPVCSQGRFILVFDSGNTVRDTF